MYWLPGCVTFLLSSPWEKTLSSDSLHASKLSVWAHLNKPAGLINEQTSGRFRFCSWFFLVYEHKDTLIWKITLKGFSCQNWLIANAALGGATKPLKIRFTGLCWMYTWSSQGQEYKHTHSLAVVCVCCSCQAVCFALQCFALKWIIYYCRPCLHRVH